MYSRCTKVRNVVERLFSKLKKYKFLRSEHAIQYDPFKVRIIFKIVCSFHNAFGAPLYSDTTEQTEDCARIMTDKASENDIMNCEHQTTNG